MTRNDTISADRDQPSLWDFWPLGVIAAIGLVVNLAGGYFVLERLKARSFESCLADLSPRRLAPDQPVLTSAAKIEACRRNSGFTGRYEPATASEQP